MGDGSSQSSCTLSLFPSLHTQNKSPQALPAMPSAKITLADCAIDASAPLADIYALLALRGGIVIKGAFPIEDTLKMRAELQPHIEERAKLDSKKA